MPRHGRGSRRTCPRDPLPSGDTARGVRPPPRVGAAALRRPLGGRVVARGVRRPRREPLGVADLRGGVLPGGRAPAGHPERHLPARADDLRVRHPGAAGPLPAPDGERRGDLVPGLVRARRGQRPGRRSRRRRCATRRPAAGGSTARRPGRRAARSAPTSSACSAPIPRRSATAASPTSWCRSTRPGVTVRGFGRLDGDEGFAEVFFDDVFVPDDLVLGEVDAGLERRDGDDRFRARAHPAQPGPLPRRDAAAARARRLPWTSARARAPIPRCATTSSSRTSTRRRTSCRRSGPSRRSATASASARSRASRRSSGPSSTCGCTRPRCGCSARRPSSRTTAG